VRTDVDLNGVDSYDSDPEYYFLDLSGYGTLASLFFSDKALRRLDFGSDRFRW
jgi:hypothetical protein